MKLNPSLSWFRVIPGLLPEIIGSARDRIVSCVVVEDSVGEFDTCDMPDFPRRKNGRVANPTLLKLSLPDVLETESFVCADKSKFSPGLPSH